MRCSGMVEIRKEKDSNEEFIEADGYIEILWRTLKVEHYRQDSGGKRSNAGEKNRTAYYPIYKLKHK